MKKYYIEDACVDNGMAKLIPKKSRELFKAIEDDDLEKVEKLVEEMARA